MDRDSVRLRNDERIYQGSLQYPGLDQEQKVIKRNYEAKLETGKSGH